MRRQRQQAVLRRHTRAHRLPRLIADVVATAPIPEHFRTSAAALSGCVGGATELEERESMLQEAGFGEISIRPRDESRTFIKDWMPVFLRVQRSLPDLRDEQSFAPWIYHGSTERHRGELSTAEPAACTSCQRRSSKSKRLRTTLARARSRRSSRRIAAYLVLLISRLPSPYREALTLIELEGMTQQAAANALGISLSGMKSRVQRGREKLRALLEACCRVAVDVRGNVIECVPKQAGTCGCKNS